MIHDGDRRVRVTPRRTPAPGQSWYDDSRTAYLIDWIKSRLAKTHPQSALSANTLTELNHAQGQAMEARDILRVIDRLRDEARP